MDANDVTEAQLEAIHDRLMPILGYRHRLVERMEHWGFPVDDKLLLLAREARDAMRALTVAVHYASCRGQVARKE